MFGYCNFASKVKFTTDRLLVRLIGDQDADKLANYYRENREFLKPWEPLRDESYCHLHGWRARLSMINALHKQGSAFYFALFDNHEQQLVGVANFTAVVRGAFYACYLGYSLAEKWQGKGLMFEGLSSAIHYLQQKQHIHRIMANYMPHNQRSENLLLRLGFEKEGYAKNYLMINGVWRDHVLTALTYGHWALPR